MNSIAINDFTQTPWAGTYIIKRFNLIVNPLSEPWVKNWMKSYEDYLDHYNSWDKRWKMRLFNNLKT
jgi:hypothetical protein